MPATPQRHGGLRRPRGVASLSPSFRAYRYQGGTRMTGEETAALGELRLGDITYSNCFPVHARLIHRPGRDDPRLVRGIPSLLNRMLHDGEIDVAPSSSIEYARNAERYLVLPDLVIGSR